MGQNCGKEIKQLMKSSLNRETCRSFLFLFKTSTYKKIKLTIDLSMVTVWHAVSQFWHNYKQPPRI